MIQTITKRITITASPAPQSGPTFIYTASLQAVWDRLRAANHPWFQYLQQAVAASLTARPWYNDFGQWSAIYYRMTGDVTHARNAINKIMPVLAVPPPDTNYMREYGAEYAILVDWLLPAMTAAERTNAFGYLQNWSQWCLALNTPTNVGGFRLGDSDQTIGQYFQIALTDLLTGSDFLHATPRWHDIVPVGGLDATAADRTTVRNTIRQYCEVLAAGGLWPESSEYNPGTLKLLFLGYLACRTATGVDHFPEVTALLPQLAAQAQYDLTPDLQQALQWGDDERPRDPNWWARLSYTAMLSGLNPSDQWLGPTLRTISTTQLGPSKAGFWRAWYCGDPDLGPITPVNATGARTCVGVGTVRWRDSRRMVSLDAIKPHLIDHEIFNGSDFQFYRDGEFAITRPIGYQGAANGPYGINGLCVAGIWAPVVRGMTASGQGPDYCWITAYSGGPYYPQPYYDPPPEFLHSWQHCKVYLADDVIVCRDVANADDPRTLPNFTRYRSGDQALINAMVALHQWTIHSPVQPTVAGNVLTWQTLGGQTVTVQVLSPAPMQYQVFDELVLWGTGSANGLQQQEKKWQTRLLSNANAAMFVLVFSVGAVPTATLNADGSVRVGNRTISFGTSPTIS